MSLKEHKLCLSGPPREATIPTTRIIPCTWQTALRDMQDNAVQMVLTDIPYGEVNDRASTEQLRTLNKGEADALDFDPIALVDELVRVCAGSFYVFCGWEQFSMILSRFRHAHGLHVSACAWRKRNPSPMNGEHFWLSSMELCVYAKKPGATFNEHCASSVWDFPIGTSHRHPTEKPLALFERLVLASSNPGDTILDPCAGSGTTGEAAFTHDRHSILIERHPKHVATIRERMAGLNTDLFHAA